MKNLLQQLKDYTQADAFTGNCFAFTLPRAVDESRHCIMTFTTVIHSRLDGCLFAANAYEGRGGCFWSSSSTNFAELLQEVADFIEDNEITA